MENATSFSPPHTRVAVVAVATGGGVRLSVTDHGIGLAPERIAEENARLERRERLDLAPTQVLGLFVVGRLARRHGLSVSLAATSGGGVTATVELPAAVLINVAPVVDPASTPGRLQLVGGRGRSASGAAPAPRVDALHRLRSILEDGTPSWNAFAISDRPADLAEPARRVAVRGVRRCRADDVRRADGPTGQLGQSGLRRRVPGAHLMDDAAVVNRPAATNPLDAEAARDLVEQFESGVHRAQGEPLHPAARPPDTAPAGTPADAAARGRAAGLAAGAAG